MRRDAMAGHVTPEEVQALVVEGWRSSEDGLYLRFRGRTGEFRLQSRCGRCHWLVHEHLLQGDHRLQVTCHACREHFAFQFAPAT